MCKFGQFLSFFTMRAVVALVQKTIIIRVCKSIASLDNLESYRRNDNNFLSYIVIVLYVSHTWISRKETTVKKRQLRCH